MPEALSRSRRTERFDDHQRQMTEFFYIEPEVAGGLGDDTVMDTDVHPPVVSRLNYQFDGWLGDVLLETFPVFIITAEAGKKLVEAGLTGLDFGPVEITKSETFEDMYPDRKLPDFAWLKPRGVAGQDDFGAAPDGRLVTSKRATDALQSLGIENALVEPYP